MFIKVDIARAALVESQNVKEFETWMLENEIYEQFLHEAFLNNNSDFFADLLQNLPRSFIVERFLLSDNFMTFVE